MLKVTDNSITDRQTCKKNIPIKHSLNVPPSLHSMVVNTLVILKLAGN